MLLPLNTTSTFLLKIMLELPITASIFLPQYPINVIAFVTITVFNISATTSNYYFYFLVTTLIIMLVLPITASNNNQVRLRTTKSFGTIARNLHTNGLPR